MKKRRIIIKIVGKTQKKIKIIGKTQKKFNPLEVAKILGATSIGQRAPQDCIPHYYAPSNWKKLLKLINSNKKIKRKKR